MNNIYILKKKGTPKMATIRVKEDTYDKWEKLAIKKTNEQGKIVAVANIINEYLEREADRLVKKFGLDVD